MREIAGQTETIYRFGRFEVDVVNCILLREGRTVAMTPKIFDLLLLFVENNGRLLTKDEIMDKVWADSFVEETNLTSNISRLRKILHEVGTDFIETLPKHGYRFKADIEPCAAPKEIVVTRRTTAGIHQTTEHIDTTEEIKRLPEAKRFWKGRLFLTAAAVAMVLIAGLAFLFFGTTADSGKIKSLAILPFKPLAPEGGNESLELGMADTLIRRLENNREITLRPLSSVRKFGGLEQDAIAAGRLLGVDSILDGSIQRWEDKIRVGLRSIRVSDGIRLWSESFDEKYTDIFLVQDAISTKVESALRLQLTDDEEKSSEKRYTNSPEAYEFYLRGRYHYQKITETEILKAIEFYRRAIEIDPAYALAYAGLADAYRTLPIAYGKSSKEGLPQAKAAALKAVELDPQLSEAHIVLGWVTFWYDWDWSTAENELKRALELAPNNSEGRRAYAHILSNLARHDEAIAEIKLAREIDPMNLLTSALYGQFLFYAGRDEEAVAINKVLEIEPNFWVAHNALGRIYIRQERFPEAIAALEKASELSSGSVEPLTQLGYALAKSGQRERALGSLSELRSRSVNHYVPAYNFSMIHNGLGQKDEALSYLEKSLDVREVQLTFVKIDTRWNNLRGEPRFIELMKRMNF